MKMMENNLYFDFVSHPDSLCTRKVSVKNMSPFKGHKMMLKKERKKERKK